MIPFLRALLGVLSLLVARALRRRDRRAVIRRRLFLVTRLGHVCRRTA